MEQVEFLASNRDSQGMDPHFTRGKSSLLKRLIAIIIFFILTTFIFLGLFVHFYANYNETVKQQLSSKTGRRPTTNCTVIKSSSTPATVPAGQETTKICTTLDCVKAAAMIANKMNKSVNPCDNFHEYACGGYNKVTALEDSGFVSGPLYAINGQNFLVMRELLTEDVSPEQPVYLQNMKRLYKSCMDEDQLNNGLQPYLRDTAFSKDWPTLNPAWDGSSFDISEVLARYAAVDTFPLFQPYMRADMYNSSKISIFLLQASFELSQEYFSRGANDTVLIAYQTYIAEFAVALGANRIRAHNDAIELMSLLTYLSKLASLAVISGTLYPTTDVAQTLTELSTLYPEIDVPRVLRANFAAANVTLYDDDEVVNVLPFYMKKLSMLLRLFSNRTVQNLFGFMYAQKRVENLTKWMRKIRLDFDKVYQGKMEDFPRWTTCVYKVSTTFMTGMAKQFVARRFSYQAKVYATEMVKNLKSAFRQILIETTWLGQKTKDSALKKLAAMREKVGYPDFNFSDDDINKNYKNYVMLEDDYYSNLVLTDRLAGLANKQSLRKPIDKNEWETAPQSLNAVYIFSGNEIAIHAAILQSPAFSLTFQDSMNYGAIGSIIGHEITHGFDHSGSTYDEQGDLKNWWEYSDLSVFQERIQCLVDQYSAFHISAINMSVDGTLTQNENVADNGGLKESYRAYKELVKKKGESPTLPGLGVTEDQLFFLSYGQMWCNRRTSEDLINILMTDPHSPGRFRIIGVLQNSEDFSRAYNCPRGSYMNPEKKCSVW